MSPSICIVFDTLEETILALSPSRFAGVTGGIEFAGEGTFECTAGGVGSWGIFVDVGYGSTDDLRGDFSGGIGVVADGGEGGAPGPKDRMAVLSCHSRYEHISLSIWLISRRANIPWLAMHQDLFE